MIDLYNKLLVYNDTNINFIIDTTNIIWFRLAYVTDILEYKSRKGVLKNIIDKKYRKHLKDIQTIHEVNRDQGNGGRFFLFLNVFINNSFKDILLV